MGRPPRMTQPGVVYHVVNRRLMRLSLPRKAEDYVVFEQVVANPLEPAITFRPRGRPRRNTHKSS